MRWSSALPQDSCQLLGRAVSTWIGPSLLSGDSGRASLGSTLFCSTLFEATPDGLGTVASSKDEEESSAGLLDKSTSGFSCAFFSAEGLETAGIWGTPAGGVALWPQ